MFGHTVEEEEAVAAVHQQVHQHIKHRGELAEDQHLGHRKSLAKEARLGEGDSGNGPDDLLFLGQPLCHAKKWGEWSLE